jgi:hypothetical protein
MVAFKPHQAWSTRTPGPPPEAGTAKYSSGCESCIICGPFLRNVISCCLNGGNSASAQPVTCKSYQLYPIFLGCHAAAHKSSAQGHALDHSSHRASRWGLRERTGHAILPALRKKAASQAMASRFLQRKTLVCSRFLADNLINNPGLPAWIRAR